MSATRGLMLAKRFSQVELLTTMAFIEGDPRSKERRADSIYLRNAKAREELDSITWAISYQLGLGEGRMTAAERVPVEGGFGYVEPTPPKPLATVSRFFEAQFKEAAARRGRE